MRRRLVVIGLDGETLDLILPWVQEGKLPHFRTLLEHGTHGELRSVIRPGSPQAWSSFITGMNPGKHRVFYFIERIPGSYDVRFVTAKSRRGEPLWSILSRHGLRTCVINVPITYPPEPVNGCLISGVDTPGIQSTYTYPPELAKEISEKVGEYVIEAGLWGFISAGRYEEALARLHFTIEQRFKTACLLYEKERWDFFMVVFTASDRVQHNFWKYMDPTHPLYTEEGNARYGKAIEEVYRKLDEKVGEFMRRVDESTTLIIMSDHGAGKNSDKAIYLNKWLESLGLLKFRDSDGNRLFAFTKRVMFVNALNFIRRQLWKRLSRPTKERLVRLMPRLRDKMTSLFLFSRIDMERTKVYVEENRSILWVNLKGRDPKGIVPPEEYDGLRDLVIHELENLRDPTTGERIVERAYRREEIYHGPYLAEAPDIVIMWNRDEYRSRPSSLAQGNGFLRVIPRDELEQIERNLQANADHRLGGILLMCGADVKRGQRIEGAEILDLTPTILYLFGLPIPKNMDGKVLVKALDDAFVASHPVRFTEEATEAAGGPADRDYTPEDAAEIAARLRGMGYIE